MVDLCPAYCEVYRRAYRKLTVALPVYKITPFLPEEQSLVEKEDKTNEGKLRDALLNSVKESLEAGRVTSFEQLLDAMTAYVDAEKDIVMERILKTMKEELKGF